MDKEEDEEVAASNEEVADTQDINIILKEEETTLKEPPNSEEQYNKVEKKERRRKGHASCCNGGEEIQASPVAGTNGILPSMEPLSPPMSTRAVRGRKLTKHFHDILKSITSCIAEFILFVGLWIVHYVCTGIYNFKSPFDTVIIILVHTIVNSLLYSSRYTTYNKKLFKNRLRKSYQ